ncbi:Uncharacterised protein [Mycobacteroides abscessus subsp. abscessus]|nr:Uncharacterised protein [Mycobacteroides abscessus subsp. abscessus]
MAAQIFCSTVYDDIGPQSDWLLKDRRKKGIIDDQ